MRRTGIACSLALLAAGSLRADFSYEETSRITGGMAAGAIKVVGVFSKQAREPMTSTVLIKGDRMAQLGKDQGTIIDLAAETITSIDFRKKTYSVTTFAQMQQAMEQAMEKMGEQREKGDVRFKVSVKDTGQRKQIAGFDCRQVVLTLAMEGTDQKTGDKGSLDVTADMWLAPRIQGYKEVNDFHLRMAKKMAWKPGGNLSAQMSSDMARGMAQVQSEAAKLDGIPVYQVIRIGGTAEGAGTGPEAQRKEEPPPSVRESIGGGLGRLAGIGGFGRKKKKEEPPAEQTPTSQEGHASGALLEITTETTGFSSAPVDGSRLEAPAGFRQVESEVVKGLK